MKIGSWTIPETPEILAAFAKRLDAAASIKPESIVLLGNDRADFHGSTDKPYSVSLTECSCADFQFGKIKEIPCKHMIRLAIETGNADQIPTFDREKSSHHDFSVEISRLVDLWESGIIPASTFSKCIEEFSKIQKSTLRPAAIDGARNLRPISAKPIPSPSFVVITGTPSQGDRFSLFEAIIDQGYTIASSISKKTSFLVVLDNPSSEKIAKAEDLGIGIVREKELWSHIENGTPFFDQHG